jgi:hypothetical protein
MKDCLVSAVDAAVVTVAAVVSSLSAIRDAKDSSCDAPKARLVDAPAQSLKQAHLEPVRQS